jgi:hypothetical protein
MKRKLNAGINFSGIESRIFLKKLQHFAGRNMQYGVGGIW